MDEQTLKETDQDAAQADVSLNLLGATLKNIGAQSSVLAEALVVAMKKVSIEGASFQETMRSLALSLSSAVAKSAFTTLQDNLTTSLSSGIGSFFSQTANLTSVSPQPLASKIASPSGAAQTSMTDFAVNAQFAKGGVLTGPTLFPLADGLGVAGEAGAEAILPLARSADGRLGVKSTASSPSQNITVNVQTQDLASFQRSEAQVSAAIARAAARGRRSL